jgi:hypothetical protein
MVQKSSLFEEAGEFKAEKLVRLFTGATGYEAWSVNLVVIV